LNKRIKLYYNYYKHGRKSGTAMAGPAVLPTTALAAQRYPLRQHVPMGKMWEKTSPRPRGV